MTISMQPCSGVEPLAVPKITLPKSIKTICAGLDVSPVLTDVGSGMSIETHHVGCLNMLRDGKYLLAMSIAKDAVQAGDGS